MDHDDMPTWTSHEDDRLREALILNKKGTKNWREVAAHVGTKSAHQCQQRWKNTLNPDVLRIKGRWTTEEDARLAELVKRHGTKNWRYIASHLRGRLPKQCRERWCNQLDPHIKKDGLTSDEWVVVKRAHEVYGNRWAEIAKQVPGRTANHIKNQWNTMLRRASADADSDGSASDDLSEDLSTSTTATASVHSITSSTRKRKPSSRYLNADEDLSFFEAAPISKRSKYVDEEEDSLSDSEGNSCETALLSVSGDHKRSVSPSPSAAVSGSAGDFTAFAALVDASCEVLQQQSPALPGLLQLMHPSFYNPQAPSLQWSSLPKSVGPLSFVPTFAY